VETSDHDRKNGAKPKSQTSRELNQIKMKKISVILFFLAVAMSATAGDILLLRNELAFEGKVKKIKSCVVVFQSGGKHFHVPAEDILALKFEDVDNPIYTDYLALSDNNSNCLSGDLDAESYHGKKGGQFALGVLFGPFALIGTALANPTPMTGAKTAMLSKNKELFSDLEYLSCYKKKAKGQLLGATAMGWASWILFLLIL
jgi:hypothetical protein